MKGKAAGAGGWVLNSITESPVTAAMPNAAATTIDGSATPSDLGVLQPNAAATAIDGSATASGLGVLQPPALQQQKQQQQPVGNALSGSLHRLLQQHASGAQAHTTSTAAALTAAQPGPARCDADGEADNACSMDVDLRGDETLCVDETLYVVNSMDPVGLSETDTRAVIKDPRGCAAPAAPPFALPYTPCVYAHQLGGSLKGAVLCWDPARQARGGKLIRHAPWS